MVLGFGVHLAADIPFLWLDSPKGRDNKFDPKSPLFVPTNTPGTTSQFDAKDPGDNAVGGATVLNASSIASVPSYDNGHLIGYTTDVADFYSLNLSIGQFYDFTALRSSGSGVISIEVQPSGGGAPIAGPFSSASSPVVSIVATASNVVVVVKYISGSVTGYDFKYQNTTGATPTLTNTPTGPTNTFTQTPTRTNTPTGPTNTFTQTPTQTPTATLTPTLTATPTLTFTPGGHGSLIDDFTANITTTLWGGSIGSAADPAGSTISVVAGAGSSLGGGTSAQSLCMSGSLHGAPIPPYPYTSISMDLDSAAAAVQIGAFCPNNGISFSYKANTVGATYRIRFASPAVTDSGYWGWNFTPADTLWHSATVYFDGAGAPVTMTATQPGWAATVAWSAVMAAGIKAVEFAPLDAGGPAALPYDLCVDDVTFNVAAIPTATPTATMTYTPTITPTYTPPAGFSGLWYNGETAGGTASDVTLTSVAGPGDTAGIVEMTDGGQSGANYLRITGTTMAGSYFFAGQIVRPVQDLTTLPFTTLNFAYRVSGASCPRMAVQLTSTNPVSYSAQSAIVNADKYTTPQGPIVPNTWYSVSIPLTEFIGANQLGGTFAAGELAVINSVQFRPESRSFNGGAITSATLDVDSVTFVGGTAPAVVGKPAVFTDFESFDGASSWATYWSSWTDQDKPDWTCNTGAPDLGSPTTRSFPACSNCPNAAPTIAVPVEHDGQGADSACSHGRIAGFKGSTGNPGPPSCGSGHYSNAGMGAQLDPGGAEVNMPVVLGFTPSAISFKVRNGSTCLASNNQQYILTIVDDLTATSPTCGGCEWQAYFYATDSWTTVTINFPATGTTGNTYTWGTWPPAGAPVFAMPPNAPAAIKWNVGNSGVAHFRQISFAPFKNDLCYDLWVDDIRFIP